MFDDPFAIDRRLRDTARAWLAFRRALRDGTAEEHRFHDAGAYASAELVEELRARAEVEPFAPSLARWAFRLHLEHRTRDLAIERERAMRFERHALDVPEAGKFTLREMLGAVLADAPTRRRDWLAALARHAGRAREFDLRLWERRAEESLALGSPLGATEPLSGVVVEHARSFLRETADAMAALAVRDVSELVEAALGRVGPAVWSSRLGPRSLAELFDEAGWLRHATLEMSELPRPLGGSSFLRGLVELGAALRYALASPSLPFTVSRDPHDLAGATLGRLFALVPCGERFARRRLEVSRAQFGEHRRALTRVVLVGARMAALRVLLRAPTLAGSRELLQAYPELALNALGVELEPGLAGVLFRARASDPHRFAALLAAAAWDARLTQTHDEDWYRNPRAVEDVREGARHAPELDVPEATLVAGARALEDLVRTAL